MNPIKSTDLTFGCEFEFTAPGRDAVYRAILAAGVPCELHTRAHMSRSNPAAWIVVPDASVAGGELVSPILKGDAGLAQVRAVCAALGSVGAKVDTSCGFHVHVGARRVLSLRQLRNVAKMFLRHEAAFDQIMPRSRRAGVNRFCQRNAAAGYTSIETKFARIDAALNLRDVAVAMNGGFDDRNHYNSYRYFALNFQSYAAHGTIEFRQHSGTVEGDKAVEWIKLVCGFVARATEIETVKNDTTPATLDELLRKTDAAGRRFYLARAAYFVQRDARRAA